MKTSYKGYWFFSLFLLMLFSCGSQQMPQQTDSTLSENESYQPKPQEKAYVLLRSEGSDGNIVQLKEILYSNFITNNISTYIVDYPLGKPWDNNQIFTTAYNDNYDYIILIDQVAKFTIDNRTNVGGKYQIRSYPLKSSNPDWIDLGQLTCNISVKPSINKFVNQILKNIVPNYQMVDDDVALATVEDSGSYKNTSTSNSSFDRELAELKRQLEIEKQKTQEVLAEKEKLELHYNTALKEEQEKTKKALAELELAKIKKQERLALEEAERLKQLEKERLANELAKQKALAEQQKQQELELTRQQEAEQLAKLQEEKEAQALAEAKKQEIEALAIAKAKEEKQRLAEKQEAERLAKLKKEQKAQALAEAKKLEEEQKLAKQLETERLAELERQQKEAKRLAKLEKEKKEKDLNIKEASTKVKVNKKPVTLPKRKTKSKTDKTRALVIVRTKPDDFDNLKKLEYNIEFDFMFAKANAKTQIMDKASALDKTDLVLQNQSDYDVFIVVDQLDYKGDGFSEYKISSCNLLQNATWQDISKNSYNLTDSDSLKALSKSIVSNL